MNAHTDQGPAGSAYPQRPPIADLKRQSNLREIVERIGVTLEKEGREYVGLCPFHDERTPSFKIYEHEGEQRWKCFGCGLGGDVLDFLQHALGLTLPQAVDYLADDLGLPPRASNPQPTGAQAKPRKLPERGRNDHNDASGAPPATRKMKRGPLIEQDDYTDEQYIPLFRVLRYGLVYTDTGEPAPGKTFLQGRIINGAYHSGMDGVRYVLYNLPAVVAATQVWLCEGERDARAVIAAGGVGTTDPGGAGAAQQFAERGYPAMLAGKDVLVVPDSDKPGRERGVIIANALHGVASRVRIAVLPEGCKDIRDYLEANGTLEDLIAAAVDFTPAGPEPSPGGSDSRSGFAGSDSASAPMQDSSNYHTNQESGGNWRPYLCVNRDQTPRPVLANAIVALEHCPVWRGVLAYNEFAVTVVARKGARLPWLDAPLAADLKWTDHEDLLFCRWLQDNGIFVQAHIAGQAVQAHGRKTRFHPVREFLQDLEWDGVPRIGTWLTDYLGAEASDLTSAMGSCWLISAVARVMRPGCQADHALILEGDQGLRKSTVLRALGEPWFTDELSDIGSKDAAMQTHGVWIIEMSELSGLQRATADTLKAFISRRVDHYRPPYGKHVVDCPRQCVFAMTVNPDASGTYKVFSDPTGARRFWPVKCTRVDLDALLLDRDQIWAEACVRYHDGVAWWLEDRELIQAAEQAQGERFTGDPWDEPILKWLENPTQRQVTERMQGQIITMPVEPFQSTAESVTIADILTHGLGKAPKDWTRADEMRVSGTLTKAGWERYRIPREAGEPRRWAYRPKPE